MEPHYISAADFAEKYSNGELDDCQIIDVREPFEWEMYHLDKAIQIPMNSIPDQLPAISQDKDAYLICAHGVRSYHVVQYLLSQGFSRAINVEGGMAEVQLHLNLK